MAPAQKDPNAPDDDLDAVLQEIMDEDAPEAEPEHPLDPEDQEALDHALDKND